MTLKFGILVLLLALDGVLSEERLPTVPTVNRVSALQQVERIRRSLRRAHHAPVQGLHSNTFRRSLLAKEGSCAWDTHSDECSLSLDIMRSLLEKSDTEFAKIVIEGLACVEKANKKDCNKEKTCVWDEGLDECYYLDWCRRHEYSPCAKAVPLICDLLAALTRCPKLDTRERCESKKQCLWDSEDASCDDDPFFVFFGIKDIEDKIDQVVDSVEASLRSQYATLQSSANFTWQSFLHYEPSIADCPPDIEQLVCEYVRVWMSNTLGPTFYCAAKYESSASQCNADSLCAWNRASTECGIDDTVVYSARLAAVNVLIESMPDGQDKRFYEAVAACDCIFEKDSCNGTCIWDSPDSECEVRSDHLAALLTEGGKNTTDAFCMLLAVDGSSDCYNQFTKNKCQKRELCRWIAYDECEPKSEFYVSAAADQDPKLKRRYRRVKKKCSSFSTKKTCLEPSKVY